MSQLVLSLQNVTIYQENKVILSQVNLEVNHGEFIYIIGKTGSGKSSFMKTLYGDLPLIEGEGHIVEFDLATLKEKDIPLEYPEMTLFMIIELVSSTVFTSIVEKQPLPIDEFKPHLYKTIRLLINEKEL